jgi:hypothetical protein
MFTYLAEGFVAISVIGSMSLLAGLLRAAKAGSQASEDGPIHPAGKDEQNSTGQQRNRRNRLLAAF